MISPDFFFNFYKFWFFRSLKGQKRAQGGGVKGKKMFWNDKKSVLLHFISLELYIIWWSFMAHMCKMLISPGVFFFHIFKILIFQVIKGAKGQKRSEMTKKLCPSRSISQEVYASYDHDCWYTYVKWWHLQEPSLFFKKI